MIQCNSTACFCRSGLAALSDLNTDLWKKIYEFLENEQSCFLAHEPEFRSPDYSWPRDPLHNWSRIWEYPFIYFHLTNFLKQLTIPLPPKILDVGSGVTFFPFAVAKSGFDVVCTDLDPVCERDLARAIKCVDHAPGRVSFRPTDGERLPFADDEADIVYCISVLEHVPDYKNLVQEIARVLKPGGLFLLTIDLDLRGDLELGPEKHRSLLAKLGDLFDYKWPETTVHPCDVLDSCKGPFGHQPLMGWRRVWFSFKQSFVKPLVGKRPRPLLPFLLTIHGLVLNRRNNEPEVRSV